LAVVLALSGAFSASPAQAAPAPVPCQGDHAGKYYCSFYVKGDGFSAGAPVRGSHGALLGYLNYGRNWVICQRQGSTLSSGSLHNNWWAWTMANDGKWGWVNALWGQGGDNDGDFQGVPSCGTAHGYPPGGAPSGGGSGGGGGGGSGGGGSGGGGGGSAPAPVPCTQRSHTSEYFCDFYPPGDGFSGGSPVESSGASVIGYLNVGSNFVLCQQVGATLSSGQYHNDWWAFTEANDGRYGWVNALYGQGGDNDGGFASVPNCGGTHGSPPTRASAPPPPQPPPPPPPVPGNGSMNATRKKIVSVALSQNGYNPDRDGCARYSTLVCPGHVGFQEWCSVFATWVWDQANVLPGNLIPIMAYSGDPYNWAARNTYVLRESQRPMAGDLVFFGSGPGYTRSGALASLHVAVILQVLPSGALFVMNGNDGGGDGIAEEATFFPSNPTADGEPGPVYGYASPVNDGGAASDWRSVGAVATDARSFGAIAAAAHRRSLRGQDPRRLAKLQQRIARRHPAFQHMPFAGRKLTIELVNVLRHPRKIVLRVLYRGSRHAAVRRYRAFLHHYHDDGTSYVVHYRKQHHRR
jgi:hypothetical protein